MKQRKINTTYKPFNRNRIVSKALKVYAHFAGPADKGAIRIIE